MKDDRTKKDAVRSLSKTLFKGKFNMDEAAYAEALSGGEITETVGANGIKYVSWAEVEQKHEKGTNKRQLVL